MVKGLKQLLLGHNPVTFRVKNKETNKLTKIICKRRYTVDSQFCTIVNRLELALLLVPTNILTLHVSKVLFIKGRRRHSDRQI